MSTFNPKISITSAPGITGFLYMVLYEASSPNAAVANSGQLAPPHLSSRQIQFTGLRPVIHIGKLFETNGVSTTGTLLANFSLDPQFAGVEVRSDLFLYAGTTDGFDVGSNQYLDPDNSLSTWEYSLEIRASGTIDPDAEYTKDVNNNPVISSGTELAGSGTYQTSENEIWVLHFTPKLINYETSTSKASWFSETEVITADRTLTVSHLSKNFIISSSTSTIEITLALLSEITENNQIYFSSEGGSHVNVIFRCQGSDQINFIGDTSYLILGQSERLIIYKYAGKYQVQNDLEGVKNVGQVVMNYEGSTLNVLACNGLLLSRLIYSRLWDYVSNKLGAGLTVTDAVWNDASQNASGKFSSGDGSTTFRLPALFNFIRGAGPRMAGSFEEMSVQQLTFELSQGNSYTGSGGAGIFGRGSTSPNQVEIIIGNDVETVPKNTALYYGIKI